MNDSETPEVFRGHFEECARHLWQKVAAQLPKGSRGAALAKQPLADFCGVGIDTVNRWIYTHSAMIGEQLIKLVFYLEMCGYKVIDLERMPKVRRNFAELIGYGILKPDDAAKLLGYNTTSAIYQILQSKVGASEDKDQKMWDIWKERKEELAQKKEKARELYVLDIFSRPRSTGKLRSPAPGATGSSHSAHCMAIGRIMEGLLGLLSDNSFTELSGEDLECLRPSSTTILQLSAQLSALGSRLITSKLEKEVGNGQ